MKKTILAAALLSVCATNSFALNLFSLHKKNPSKPLTQSLKANGSSNYTDFSGTWVGTCTSGDNESGSSSITIRNDDVSIEINEEEYRLGDVKTDATSNKSDSEFSHTIINWNEDRTKLLFEDTSSRFEHSEYPYNKQKSPSTILMKGSISLINEQLTLKVEGIGFNGLSATNEKLATSCTFDKAK